VRRVKLWLGVRRALVRAPFPFFLQETFSGGALFAPLLPFFK
jgi:hypothetical protein